MQLNETIVIGFLVVVILVLIFSKISVKLNSDDSNTNESNHKRTKRMNNSRNHNNSSRNDNNNTQSPDDYNLKTSGLLSNDFKKQLDEIENRFYTSSCTIKK